MRYSRVSVVAIFLALMIWSSNAGQKGGSGPAIRADVDDARIVRADQEAGNWMSDGRTYTEQRFGPLEQVNDRNVAQLGLAWYYDLDTNRGQEATPIVVDGVMYFNKKLWV